MVTQEDIWFDNPAIFEQAERAFVKATFEQKKKKLIISHPKDEAVIASPLLHDMFKSIITHYPAECIEVFKTIPRLKNSKIFSLWSLVRSEEECQCIEEIYIDDDRARFGKIKKKFTRKYDVVWFFEKYTTIEGGPIHHRIIHEIKSGHYNIDHEL